MGVVLSGAASDGTLGAKAIKAEGGITFAQDDSARFESMPHSAIAANAGAPTPARALAGVGIGLYASLRGDYERAEAACRHGQRR